MTEKKYCKKCNTTKIIDDFYKRDGKCRSNCKQCELEYNKKWKKTEKGKLAKKRYLHSESFKKSIRKYKKIHPEKIKELKSKRERGLGFISINEKILGTVAHHLNDEYVMYIPEELHRKCTYPDREMHRLLVLNELYIQGIIL